MKESQVLYESFKSNLNESEEYYYNWKDSRVENNIYNPKIIYYVLKHNVKFDGYIPKNLGNKKLINQKGKVYSEDYKEIKEFPSAEALANEAKKGAIITLGVEPYIYGNSLDIIALYDDYCDSRQMAYIDFHEFNRKIKNQLKQYRDGIKPCPKDLFFLNPINNSFYIGNDATSQFINLYNEMLSNIDTKDFYCELYYF